MHTCTVARALWHAVGSQVERGVRQHCFGFDVKSRVFECKACHSRADYASCRKPDSAASKVIGLGLPK
jgi:hypothetical protein